MNENVLVAYDRNNPVATETFSFDDIPEEEYKMYADVIIALHNWEFCVEINGKIYSSLISKTICTCIQLITDAALVYELRINMSGKCFLYLSRVENSEILAPEIIEEGSEKYEEFFSTPVGEEIMRLVARHISNPTYIPVGRCA